MAKTQYKKVERLTDEEQDKVLKDLPRLSEFMVFNETDLDYAAIGKAMEGMYKFIIIEDDTRKSIKDGEERCFDLTFKIGKDSQVEYMISCGLNLKNTKVANVFRITKNRELTKYEATRPIGTPDFVKKGFGEIR